MLPIFWLESADADLATITDYIGQYDVIATERLWDRRAPKLHSALSCHGHQHRDRERGACPP
jgi:hypothetical protein